MFDERLYVMALYATRPLGATADPHAHEVSLRVALAVASTEEEAREKGSARLLEWCPPGEGWVNHRVSLNHVPRAAMQRALEFISGDSRPGVEGDEGEDDPPDWPERLIVHSTQTHTTVSESVTRAA